MAVDLDALKETRRNIRQRLLQARAPAGYWEGELSSSALATATAVFALSLCEQAGAPGTSPASRWLRLPVVSYALPALIAMGQVRHRRLPSRNPAARWARGLASPASLRVLHEIQPEGGGFLEATPLTSFVVMSMAGAGLAGEAVVE